MKLKFTTQVDQGLLQRIRAVVRGVSHVSRADYTLREFVEDALTRHAAHLEKTYNDGEPWPQAAAPLKRGRRFTS